MDLAQHTGQNRTNISRSVNYYLPHSKLLRKSSMTTFKLYGISMGLSLLRRRERREVRKVAKRRSDDHH